MREHHVAAAEIVFFSYAMGSVVIFSAAAAARCGQRSVCVGQRRARVRLGRVVLGNRIRRRPARAGAGGWVRALVAVTGGCAALAWWRYARDPAAGRSWPQ